MRGKGLIAAAISIAVVLGTVPATTAKPKHSRIESGKGAGGVNLGLKRGPITVRKNGKVRRVNTVHSMLGKPQRIDHFPRDGSTFGEKKLYGATYSDDELFVYFQKRGKNGRFDSKVDAYDKVVGVTVFSSRYRGALAPGQAFDDSNGPCAPLDKRSAPGGGPRRVFACKYEPPSDTAVDVVYMSAGAATRAEQQISQTTIFVPLIGEAVFQALLAGALEDLDCETIAC